jgi:hypothetical protein
VGNASGNGDVGRSATSSSDSTGSRDGRTTDEATLLEVADEAAASTAGLLGEGGLDALGETDGEVGDETEETAAEVELLVDSETKVAAKLTSDINTSAGTGTTANGSSVVEEREPDAGTEANISTSLATQTENRDLESAANAELRTETETKLKIDTSTELDIGTDANGESLGDETLKRSVDDLLGKKRNVDVGRLRELDVDTSREINSLTTADNEIDSDGSLNGSLQLSVKTGNSNTKLGSSEEFDGLVDGSGSREIDLNISRDATETNTNVGSSEEVSTASEANVTSDLAAGEVQAQVDSGSS